MADSNNINRGNDHTVAAEDPFAELARLLSGDSEQEPHESRAQPEPVNNEPAAETPAAADPFAVDLEKELLGDLADVEAAHAAGTVEQHDDGQYQDDAPEMLDTDEPGAFEAAEEPDVWADDEQAGAEDLAYREEMPAYEPSFEEMPSDAGEPEGYDADENTDPVVADVDMDFGELDTDGAEPAAAEPHDEFVAEVPDAETPEAVSLEEELQMLLADTADEVPHSPAARGAPAGAVAEAASRLGRANYVNAHGVAAPVETGGWDESAQTADDQEDAGDAVGSFDDSHAAEFPVADDAASEPDNADNDPFADLAAIMARSGGGETSPQAEQVAAPVDIETVEVPETAFEQADDLQLPDPPADEPAPQHPDDEFEADLGYDFNIQPAALDDTAVPEAAASEETPDNQDDEDRFYAEALGLGTAAGTAAAFEAAAYARGEPHEQNVDVAIDEAMSIGDDYDQPAQESRDGRSGFLIAGAVVAVALIGGIGAFALSFGGGDGPETPVLVEADSDPVKVKPESPGGAAVPEQDSAAHEAASGVANTEPKQESLVSTTEEPVNIASRTVGADRLPGVDEPASDTAATKSEDRLEPAATEAETALANDVIAVQPRRVRTMIVRPDGTLVAREEPATPAAEAAAQPAPAVETTQPVRQIETTQPAAASEPAVAQTQDETPAATTTAQPETVVAAEAPATDTAVTEEAVAENAADDPVTPSVGPVATPRPASQQTAEPQQVAQAAPAARTEPVAPAPAPVVVEENSTWSMQIASQPTAESAQATYQDLARRYGELLGGRGVNIVRAEIPGKGTYYRVRIPTTSRADGIALCERYKAIGGSCFVSK